MNHLEVPVVYPAAFAASNTGMMTIGSVHSSCTSTSSSVKRVRDDHDDCESYYSDASSGYYSYDHAPMTTVPNNAAAAATISPPIPSRPDASSPAKKTRSGTYRPPRQVPKKSLLSAMGTLAAGGAAGPAVPPPIRHTSSNPTTTTSWGMHTYSQQQQQQQQQSQQGPPNNNHCAHHPMMQRVQLRRQLSGSNLESFLGNHDQMDTDNSDGNTDASSRPRSMSF